MALTKKHTTTSFHHGVLPCTPENIAVAKAILCDQTGQDECTVIQVGISCVTDEPIPGLVWGVLNSEGSLFFKGE
jgi:hypothetical protein